MNKWTKYILHTKNIYFKRHLKVSEYKNDQRMKKNDNDTSIFIRFIFFEKNKSVGKKVLNTTSYQKTYGPA